MSEAQRDLVEEYRRRFLSAPLGLWVSVHESTGFPMDESWELRPDHTGEYLEYSGQFKSGQRRSTFAWREQGPLQIGLSWISIESDEDDETEEDEGESWETIRYDFQLFRAALGVEYVILYEPGSMSERFGQGPAFSWGHFPLRLLKPR